MTHLLESHLMAEETVEIGEMAEFAADRDER
jgi:hypothetical protein